MLVPDTTNINENDVHCEVDGYSKLAAMKSELKLSYDHVGVVSSGDFVQGGTLGAVSKGEYIVQLMNKVGYDAIALGNHEFDYRIARLEELNNLSDTKFISCNFAEADEDASYFDSYRIVSYGSVDIAYIGITTPDTIHSSDPAQFKDEDGEIIYTFNEANLYDIVQANIDAVLAAGADYVVALSHVGYDESGDLFDITDIVENTDGFDVVLDAHAHLVIYIAEIKESYSELGNRVIGQSTVTLDTHDGDTRLVRNSETALGNLCSDALRVMTGADISFVNGGGLRAPIKAGEVTFNDIFTVFPYNNQVVTVEITGQMLLDMLEMGVMKYPEENGAFPSMSGVIFSVNTAIPTSVKTDENGFFTNVHGDYRVYDVKVLDKATGEYRDLELEGKYVLAGFNYHLLSQGDGMAMFEDARLIDDEGTLDIELIEGYITDHLGGVIGEEYAEPQGRITFTDGYVN